MDLIDKKLVKETFKRENIVQTSTLAEQPSNWSKVHQSISIQPQQINESKSQGFYAGFYNFNLFI